MSSLFAGLGGSPCNGDGTGRPTVLYDSFANRWLLAAFDFSSNPGHQCIAISQSADPTGSYYVYDFVMPERQRARTPALRSLERRVLHGGPRIQSSGDRLLGGRGIRLRSHPDDRRRSGGELRLRRPAGRHLRFRHRSAAFRRGWLAPPPPGLAQRLYRSARHRVRDPIDAFRIYEFVPDFGTPARRRSPLSVRTLALADLRRACSPCVNPIEQGTGPGVHRTGRERVANSCTACSTGTSAPSLRR